jgi:hypothetical protein
MVKVEELHSVTVSYQTNLDDNSIDIDEYGGISHQGKKVLVRSPEPKILLFALLIVLS